MAKVRNPDINTLETLGSVGLETIQKIKRHKFNAQASGGKKSQLEVRCEKMLEEASIPFQYETQKVVLNESFEWCHDEYKKKELIRICQNRAVSYTIDFNCPDMKWVIEAKGMKTPDWKIKFKFYKEYMKHHYPECKIFVVSGIGDIQRVIKIIQEDQESRQIAIKRPRKKDVS